MGFGCFTHQVALSKLSMSFFTESTVRSGTIRYAVLASGGFLGLGDRLFAVPWKALKQDRENDRFMLDVDLERLKNAPGFDKDNWPNMADPTWNSTVESYYAT